MNRKVLSALLILVAALAIGSALWFTRAEPQEPAAIPVPAASPIPDTLRPALPEQQPDYVPPAVAATVPPHGMDIMSEPDRRAVIEIDQIKTTLSDFRTLFGQNPVGTNAEIMKAMMGGNAKQATLGPPEGQTLNGEGEIIDHWGTPYFFHQLSATEMEIRSAGADKKMWTEDDIVQ